MRQYLRYTPSLTVHVLCISFSLAFSRSFSRLILLHLCVKRERLWENAQRTRGADMGSIRLPSWLVMRAISSVGGCTRAANNIHTHTHSHRDTRSVIFNYGNYIILSRAHGQGEALTACFVACAVITYLLLLCFSPDTHKHTHRVLKGNGCSRDEAGSNCTTQHVAFKD